MSSSSSPQPISTADRSPSLLAAVWIMQILSTAVFVARMYIRRCFNRQFGADDYWMGATVVLSMLFTIMITVDVMNGFGRHIDFAETISTPKTLVLLSLSTMLISVVETLTIKMSITSYLLRLRPSRSYKLVIWTVILANVITVILGFIVCLTQCQPLGKMWDPSRPGTCWPQSVMIDAFYTVCVVCGISWWVYILLPVAYTWNLQLPAYTKRAIWGLMGLGLIPAVCSILKIAYVVDMTDSDVTWSQDSFYVVFTIEMNMGVIVASIPPLKPFIDSRWPGLLTSTKRGSSHKSSFGRMFAKLPPSTDKSTDSRDKSVTSSANATKEQCVVINGLRSSSDNLGSADSDPSCIVVEHRISIEHGPNTAPPPPPGTAEGVRDDWNAANMA